MSEANIMECASLRCLLLLFTVCYRLKLFIAVVYHILPSNVFIVVVYCVLPSNVFIVVDYRMLPSNVFIVVVYRMLPSNVVYCCCLPYVTV